MSDVLVLAQSLRKLSDSQLAQLCRRCLIQPTHLKDFFDLAEQLLAPKSLQAWLASQNGQRLRALNESPTKFSSADPLFGYVAKRLKTDPKSLGENLQLFLSNLADSRKLVLAGDGFAHQAGEPLSEDDEYDAKDAGIRAFLACQALTEFVFELEHKLLSEVGKAGLALPEVKRFASLLGIEREQVRELWELAHFINLVALQDARWVLGGTAAKWLEGTTEERWQIAVESWLGLVGIEVAQDLASEITQGETRTLAEVLEHVYPLADTTPGSRGAKITDHAELLGLTAKGRVQPWLASALTLRVVEAASAISAYFPQQQSKVILQADLSLVVPGPLAERTEIELREYVDADSIGLASHFRISALSLSYAMERGHSTEQIRASLLNLSGQTLPQPVDYLLNDTARRFGRIKVVADPDGGSFIRVADSTLALELVNDLRHRIIALRQLEPELLYSKYSMDVVYYTLRDFGHLAVRSTEDGKVIPPVKLSQLAKAASKTDAIEAMIERLRSAESKSEAGDDDSKLRQLQLAIKNKATIRVIYLGKDGAQHEFVLEPIGVANGRLRARDRKSDIERTLPISNIASLELA